jgi:hypothetical protein
VNHFWNRVIRQEYNALFALIATLFLLKTVDGFFNAGRLVIDKPWLVLTTFGLVVWLVLRTMKKKTRWLNARDR